MWWEGVRRTHLSAFRVGRGWGSLNLKAPEGFCLLGLEVGGPAGLGVCSQLAVGGAGTQFVVWMKSLRQEQLP